MGAPSIVPESLERDIYFVLDDLGSKLGRIWHEMDEGDTDRTVVIQHLIEGQYANPVRIVALNIAAGWSRDVNCRKASGSIWTKMVGVIDGENGLEPRLL